MKDLESVIVIVGWVVLAEVVNEVVGYRMIEVDTRDIWRKGK